MSKILITSMLVTITALAIVNNPSQPGLTRSAQIKQMAIAVAGNWDVSDFDCVNNSQSTYQAICDSLGLQLEWQELRKSYVGRMNYEINKVEMAIPICDHRTPFVFFHKIGHYIIDHRSEEDYETIQEPEADAFSVFALNHIGLDIPSWYYRRESRRIKEANINFELPYK